MITVDWPQPGVIIVIIIIISSSSCGIAAPVVKARQSPIRRYDATLSLHTRGDWLGLTDWLAGWPSTLFHLCHSIFLHRFDSAAVRVQRGIMEIWRNDRQCTFLIKSIQYSISIFAVFLHNCALY